MFKCLIKIHLLFKRKLFLDFRKKKLQDFRPPHSNFDSLTQEFVYSKKLDLQIIKLSRYRLILKRREFELRLLNVIKLNINFK